MFKNVGNVTSDDSHVAMITRKAAVLYHTIIFGSALSKQLIVHSTIENAFKILIIFFGN